MKYALGVLVLGVLLGFVWFSRAPQYRSLTVALCANAATPEAKRIGPFEWWQASPKREPVFLEVGEFDVTPKRVSTSAGSMGESGVGVELRASDGQRFSEFTEKHVGRELAILLDDRVLTVGVISERLPASLLLGHALAPSDADELLRRLRE